MTHFFMKKAVRVVVAATILMTVSLPQAWA
jgi:hypothetical protein